MRRHFGATYSTASQCWASLVAIHSRAPENKGDRRSAHSSYITHQLDRSLPPPRSWGINERKPTPRRRSAGHAGLVAIRLRAAENNRDNRCSEIGTYIRHALRSTRFLYHLQSYTFGPEGFLTCHLTCLLLELVRLP